MLQNVSTQLESMQGNNEKIVAVEKEVQKNKEEMEALEKKLNKKIKKRDERVCILILLYN